MFEVAPTSSAPEGTSAHPAAHQILSSVVNRPLQWARPTTHTLQAAVFSKQLEFTLPPSLPAAYRRKTADDSKRDQCEPRLL
jgi:hypothetical protein